MDLLETIRRGYHALGLGADEYVRAMLDQRGSDPACWEVRSFELWHSPQPAGEIAALALFEPLPPQYELTQVRVRSWTPNPPRGRLVVDGSCRVRVRGTWEAMDLPSSHVWSFTSGRVRSVRNALEGFELRRVPAGKARPV
jgi:hypothetical protein